MGDEDRAGQRQRGTLTDGQAPTPSTASPGREVVDRGCRRSPRPAVHAGSRPSRRPARAAGAGTATPRQAEGQEAGEPGHEGRGALGAQPGPDPGRAGAEAVMVGRVVSGTGVPNVNVTTKRTRNRPITRISAPRSRGCADCMVRLPQGRADRIPDRAGVSIDARTCSNVAPMHRCRGYAPVTAAADTRCRSLSPSGRPPRSGPSQGQPAHRDDVTSTRHSPSPDQLEDEAAVLQRPRQRLRPERRVLERRLHPGRDHGGVVVGDGIGGADRFRAGVARDRRPGKVGNPAGTSSQIRPQVVSVCVTSAGPAAASARAARRGCAAGRRARPAGWRGVDALLGRAARGEEHHKGQRQDGRRGGGIAWTCARV